MQSLVEGRKFVLNKWMTYYKVNMIVRSRAILSWCLQTDIIAKDEFSDAYFLISTKNPGPLDFKLSLIKNYPLAFDKALKRAKIPNLRVKVCADLHMPLPIFDKMLKT